MKREYTLILTTEMDEQELFNCLNNVFELRDYEVLKRVEEKDYSNIDTNSKEYKRLEELHLNQYIMEDGLLIMGKNQYKNHRDYIKTFISEFPSYVVFRDHSPNCKYGENLRYGISNKDYYIKDAEINNIAILSEKW